MALVFLCRSLHVISSQALIDIYTLPASELPLSAIYFSQLSEYNYTPDIFSVFSITEARNSSILSRTEILIVSFEIQTFKTT